MTYEDLERKYQRISAENTSRARKKDTAEAYDRAQSRERLIRKAFFNDCKKYLDGNLKPKF
jgi:hypothetical protein